jgi:alanine dehydrogenase
MIPTEHITPTPQEAPVETIAARRHLTIGLPKCLNSAEKSFPLTPEAVQVLTRNGFRVNMEAGGAESIHYCDSAYAKAGVHLTTRRDALQSDIVIHMAPLEIADIRMLRRNAMWLSLANFNRQQAREVIEELVNRRITNIAIDLITDEHGNHPFGDILSEINGRSAITIAAAMLADPINGKGILLGGIAGVIPCEVTVIGSCLAAMAAARSAMGLGAVVRLFDDDVYRLRTAIRQLGGGVIGSSVHPHALENALRTADVIIISDRSVELPIEGNYDNILKRKVLVFDLSSTPGQAFPGMRTLDLGEVEAVNGIKGCASAHYNETFDKTDNRRTCLINAGSAVPRTTAMALSDTFVTLLTKLASREPSETLIPLTAGMEDATLTYMGKVVNERVATLAGMRFTDIRLLMSLS